MARGFRSSPDSDADSCPIRLSSKARLLASVAALVNIATRLSNKLKAANSRVLSSRTTRTSSFDKPKQLMVTLSNKAITLLHRNKRVEGGRPKKKSGAAHKHVDDEEEYGDGGVWQRSILMGDKCEPLDFSGVIYYDEKGQQLNGVPLRSPRASPMPGYLERGQKI